jgi:hypothetical protein
MRATGSASRAHAAPAASTIHAASIVALRIVNLLFHTHASSANRLSLSLIAHGSSLMAESQ